MVLMSVEIKKLYSGTLPVTPIYMGNSIWWSHARIVTGPTGESMVSPSRASINFSASIEPALL